MASHDPLPVFIACAGIAFVVSMLAFRERRRVARSAFASPPTPPATVRSTEVNPATPDSASKRELRSIGSNCAILQTPIHPLPLPRALAFAPEPSEIGANPLWRFFEKHGFVWLTPREDVEAQAAPLLLPPWNDKVIPLHQSHPDLQKMIVPVCFGAGAQPAQLPPVEFYGVLSPTTDDPKMNFDRMVASLAADLGPHQTAPSTNVYSAVWKAGPAEISVMVWPRHLNPWQYRSDSWQGNPATREAVHVYFKTGLAFQLHEEEERALSAARPLELSSTAFLAIPQRHLGAHLGLLRTLPTGRAANFQALRGKLLLNDAAQHLFAVGEECAWVVPLQLATGLRLVRVTPAKGSGYSALSLCLTPWAAKRRSELGLANGDGPDDLTILAENLGPQLGLPVMIEPYMPDE